MTRKFMIRAAALMLATTMVWSTQAVSGAAGKKNLTVKERATNTAVAASVVVKKGGKLTLQTTAAKCKVTFSKKGVVNAKVTNKKITLSAKKSGTTKVTVAKKGYQNRTFTVTVAQPATLALSSNKVSVNAGKTKVVKVTKFTPSKAAKNASVKVTTSNKKVVTAKYRSNKVSLTGVKAGKAVVTVYSSDLSAVKKITVTVKSASNRSSAANNQTDDSKQTTAYNPSTSAASTTQASSDTTQKAELTAKNGVFTLPCSYDKVTGITFKGKGIIYGITGEPVQKAIAEFKKQTAAQDFATKKAGDKFNINGMQAEIKSKNPDGSAVVYFAGKDRTVTVTNTTLTIDDTTFTPDTINNTLTVTNSSGVDKTEGVTLEITYLK